MGCEGEGKRRVKFLSYVAAYILAVVTAPILGFTAVMDIGYAVAGEPLWALLWVFLFGPACMFGLFYLSERSKR
jgi:hypothetical protein